MIVVPFAKPHARTAGALTGRDWTAVWVGERETAYFELIAGLWAAGETFTLVEHDIVPTGAALDSLDACTADWCACPYPYHQLGLYAGLGCTRFRPSIIARNPGLFATVARRSDNLHPPMHWCRLDLWITETLGLRGERRCEQHPHVAHRAGPPAHGCI